MSDTDNRKILRRSSSESFEEARAAAADSGLMGEAQRVTEDYLDVIKRVDTRDGLFDDPLPPEDDAPFAPAGREVFVAEPADPGPAVGDAETPDALSLLNDDGGMTDDAPSSPREDSVPSIFVDEDPGDFHGAGSPERDEPADFTLDVNDRDQAFRGDMTVFDEVAPTDDDGAFTADPDPVPPPRGAAADWSSDFSDPAPDEAPDEPVRVSIPDDADVEVVVRPASAATEAAEKARDDIETLRRANEMLHASPPGDPDAAAADVAVAKPGRMSGLMGRIRRKSGKVRVYETPESEDMAASAASADEPRDPVVGAADEVEPVGDVPAAPPRSGNRLINILSGSVAVAALLAGALWLADKQGYEVPFFSDVARGVSAPVAAGDAVEDGARAAIETAQQAGEEVVQGVRAVDEAASEVVAEVADAIDAPALPPPPGGAPVGADTTIVDVPLSGSPEDVTASPDPDPDMVVTVVTDGTPADPETSASDDSVQDTSGVTVMTVPINDPNSPSPATTADASSATTVVLADPAAEVTADPAEGEVTVETPSAGTVTVDTAAEVTVDPVEGEVTVETPSADVTVDTGSPLAAAAVTVPAAGAPAASVADLFDPSANPGDGATEIEIMRAGMSRLAGAVEAIRAGLDSNRKAIETLVGAIGERDGLMKERDSAISEALAKAEEAAAMVAGQNEILAEFIRVKDQLGQAEARIVDLSQRMGDVEVRDPADKTEVTRRIDALNRQVTEMARNVNNVAAYTVKLGSRLEAAQAGPDLTPSSSPAPGAGAVYESAPSDIVRPRPRPEGGESTTTVAVDIPSDVEVGDVLEGRGEVIEVKDMGSGNRMVITDKGTWFTK